MANLTQTEHQTIHQLFIQLEANAQRVTKAIAEAKAAMENGWGCGRNEAVGMLIGTEKDLEQIAAIKDTILLLHRR